LTLDPDVAEMLETEAHRRRVSFKQVVNDAIRRGLGRRPAKSDRPYRVVAHKTKLRGGIDPAGFNKLADEVSDETESQKFGRTT
jgi:hypothetical protein